MDEERRKIIQEKIAQRQQNARDRRELILQQRCKKNCRYHAIIGHKCQVSDCAKKDVATSLINMDNLDVDELVVEEKSSAIQVHNFTDILRRAPLLLSELAEAGLSESATDYYASSADSSAGDGNSTPRVYIKKDDDVPMSDAPSRRDLASRAITVSNESECLHHLHLSPRRVTAILQHDVFAPCTMCRKKRPITKVCSADPLRKHQTRLTVTARKLLSLLLSSDDASCDDFQHFLSAFLAAAQYRDDSFSAGREPLDALAEPVESADTTLNSVEKMLETTFADATTAESSLHVAPQLIRSVEGKINLEAARLVNALYFIHDRVKLVSAVGEAAVSQHPFELVYDLPEQLARFSAVWSRYRKFVTITQTPQYKNVCDVWECKQQASLITALHSMKLSTYVSHGDGDDEESEMESGSCCPISAQRILRQEKISDLIAGVEEQLRLMSSHRGL